MPHELQLFPGDKEASPGDAVIQFLIEEQKRGNKRFKSTMESVFPGFGKAIDKVISGSEKRRKKLNELFGTKLGEPITGEDITELALGFGVGSIKGITGVPGIGMSFRARPIEGVDPALSNQRPVVNINELTSQGPHGVGAVKNIGGQKPPTALLEKQAVEAQAKKATQTKVKQIQKDLQALAIEEVIPDAPPNLVRGLAQKGLRAKAKIDEESGGMTIRFESKPNIVHPEFTLRDTPEALILEVNYNSSKISSKVAEIYRETFKNKFIDETLESPNTQRQMQRMLKGKSAEAGKPAHFAEFLINDFGDGLRTITEMLDIANAR